MSRILIFGGTTEGRELAERLAEQGVPSLVSVASEYGSEVMPKSPLIEVRIGRLTSGEMKDLYSREKPLAVVDATHPYADIVTENIQESLRGLPQLPYFRLLRAETEGENENCRHFRSSGECAAALAEMDGKILLTTGSKELPVFCENPQVRERITARVLPSEEAIHACLDAGLRRQQIIAMQGPFSEDMDFVTLRDLGASILVMKDSGRAGGSGSKLRAAARAGAACLVIDRPKEHAEGRSFNEVLEVLLRLSGTGDDAANTDRLTNAPSDLSMLTDHDKPGGSAAASDETDRGEQSALHDGSEDMALTVTLAGVGMGDAGTMTAEVLEAIGNADCLFGAKRMISPYASRIKSYPYYLARDILPVLKTLPNGSRAVILFSGDTGFFSGAEKMKTALADIPGVHVIILPGISSVSALAARTGTSWQDAAILSTHGVPAEEWVPRVRDAAVHRAKTFCITSGASDLREIGRALEAVEGVRILAGFSMGTKEERVVSFSAKEAENADIPGLCTVLIRNVEPEEKILTPGRSDASFIRGKVPMTKEEVRALTICRLELTEHSVFFASGSGTGSIAVEAAALSPGIRVFAIERNPEGVELIRKNAERFGTENVTVTEGAAPEALAGLPAPTHAFIGGSGGKLREILAKLRSMNPSVRVVMNAVSLETVAEIQGIFRDMPVRDESVSLIAVSRAEKLGRYHLMKAQNPVYLVAFQFADP